MHVQPAEPALGDIAALKPKVQRLMESRVSLQQQYADLSAERDALLIALQHVFPYASYRDQRPDLATFNDEDLLSHYVNHGIREGVNLSSNAIEAKRNTLATHNMELTAQLDTLQKERDLLREESNTLKRKNLEKLLIHSIIKHGFRELPNMFPEQSESDLAASGEQGMRFNQTPRQLVKTIGTTIGLGGNEDHRHAMSHALSHFTSKTVCTYIPKNACTNLRYSLAVANGVIKDKEDFDWIHANNETCGIKSIREAIDARYTFIILRNPFTRLVSFYLDKLCRVASAAETDRSYNNAQDLFPFSDVHFSFREFINDLWTNPEKLNRDHHIRPQVDFLLYVEYDDWFCVENLAEATSRIKKNIGLEVIDTRPMTSHTTLGLAEAKREDLADMSIKQIAELREAGLKPSPLYLYDPDLAYKVCGLYHSDVSLYCNKFGRGGEISNWLALARQKTCA